MRDWLTADLHLGHARVAELRGFTSVEEHDDTIMANLGKMVQPGDRLWILGDISSGSEDGQRHALRVLDSHLFGRPMHLISGNHDSVHPMHSKAHKRWARHGEVFSSVQSVASMKFAGERAILHHMPYDGDHTDTDRFEQWRVRDVGATIIHGHTHADFPLSTSREGTTQLCVSLDAWGMEPVAKETLEKIVRGQW